MPPATLSGSRTVAPVDDLDGAEPDFDAPVAGSSLRSRLDPRAVVTVAMVAGSVLLVLSQLSPRNLLTTTTTTGGDTGAHIWAADYLQHHLLPHGRLTGWSPDWYAGFPAFVFYFPIPFLAIVALNVVLPYAIAFKWVTAAGPLTLPLAAYLFGRLCRLERPKPALLAAATLPFLFDQSYSILGGNLPSTLAGEFSFSISLTASLLFLGVAERGMGERKWRGRAAVLLAFAVLCHVYAALLAILGSIALVALRRERAAARWALQVWAAGAALTAFWIVPFVARVSYTTDMGWEKDTNYLHMLFPFLQRTPDGSGTAIFGGVLALALVALALGLRRRNRVPLALAAVAGVAVLTFVAVPQGRLYNSRVLPVWFLSVHLLAGLGLADIVGLLAGGRMRRSLIGALTAFAVVVGAVGVPLHLVPGWVRLPEVHDRGLRLVRADTIAKSWIPDWAEENYKGYEGADRWPEYAALVRTMRGLPCGRALEEFSETWDVKYGTTAAMMLLPYWTHGCISTMEGMFYESSATTPYHFLTEAELSRTPSAPMRKLPYGTLDVHAGVAHLRALGVRYYLSFSKRATAQASAEPQLRLVASTGPWRVWEVRDTTVVEPLPFLPAVMTGLPRGGTGWLDAGVAAFTDGNAAGVPFAAGGPSSWPRARLGTAASDGNHGSAVQLPTVPLRPVGPTRVSHVRMADNRVSFDVDRVGTPILVKVSYFPNWTADGADGPWRVTPNFMVVVPTSKHVSLRYASTPVDVIGWLGTAAGAAGVAWLGRDSLRRLARGWAARLRRRRSGHRA